MGAGKSTLGREVAARLHRPFLDVDAEIESREGPIPELFERGAFRELEERAALEALGDAAGRDRPRRRRRRDKGDPRSVA